VQNQHLYTISKCRRHIKTSSISHEGSNTFSWPSGVVGGIGGSSCNCAHAKHNVAAKYKNPSRAAAAGAL
jgi:hypothetical protein